MNYYSFHIGDYRRDTVHLSPTEHYIYRQLIDWYYLDELPIPKKTQVVLRRLGLGSDGLSDLENVLSDFFEESKNGWVHGRIEDDLASYRKKADKARQNGKKGGRPIKQQLSEQEKPKKTQPVISWNPEETGLKANQEPITNNQEPINNTTLYPPLDDQEIENVNGRCQAKKKNGIQCTRDAVLSHNGEMLCGQHSIMLQTGRSQKTPKTILPEGFGISDRVRKWALEKHYTNLEDHLENFISSAKAKSYTYASWDDAFMNAVRQNWAKIGERANETHQRPGNGNSKQIDHTDTSWVDQYNAEYGGG